MSNCRSDFGENMLIIRQKVFYMTLIFSFSKISKTIEKLLIIVMGLFFLMSFLNSDLNTAIIVISVVCSIVVLEKQESYEGPL